jgi:hypothetical protein
LKFVQTKELTRGFRQLYKCARFWISLEKRGSRQVFRWPLYSRIAVAEPTCGDQPVNLPRFWDVQRVAEALNEKICERTNVRE